MEINYDLIMKYLVTKKTLFASKKHILVYSDLFPEKFKNILQNKFYRYGINQNNLQGTLQNNSFYSSILTLLNKNFITNNNDEEMIEINKFKDSLNKILVEFELPNNLNSINKHNIIYSKFNEQTIQIISEILLINFIIFDFKNESIKIIYNGTVCNPYKSTLLIGNYEEFYEPMMYEIDNKKIFSYNDLIIKKIYNSEIETYPILNKEYKLYDSLKDIVNEFNINDTINNDIGIFTTNNIIESNILQNESEYSQSKLNKMVKKNLEEILDKKKIKYSSKMLKKDLIDLILQ